MPLTPPIVKPKRKIRCEFTADDGTITWIEVPAPDQNQKISLEVVRDGATLRLLARLDGGEAVVLTANGL